MRSKLFQPHSGQRKHMREAWVVLHPVISHTWDALFQKVGGCPCSQTL